MKVSKKWIIKNYLEFNKKYFDNKLPIVKFNIDHNKYVFGYADFENDYVNNTIIPYSISISNYYDTPEEVKKNTLLHEMIHIYEYITYPMRFFGNRYKYYNGHGMFFQMNAALINKDGWNILTTLPIDQVKTFKK